MPLRVGSVRSDAQLHGRNLVIPHLLTAADVGHERFTNYSGVMCGLLLVDFQLLRSDRGVRL